MADVIGSARLSESREPLVRTQRWIASVVTIVCLAIASGTRASAQELREIRLVADPDAESYRFEPASIAVKAGDVLLFRVVSGAPHNIAFEPGAMNEATRPRGRGANALAHTGTDRSFERPAPGCAPGLTYRVVVPTVPAGNLPVLLSHPTAPYDEAGRRS